MPLSAACDRSPEADPDPDPDRAAPCLVEGRSPCTLVSAQHIDVTSGAASRTAFPVYDSRSLLRWMDVDGRCKV